jgi:hypothetical protein
MERAPPAGAVADADASAGAGGGIASDRLKTSAIAQGGIVLMRIS